MKTVKVYSTPPCPYCKLAKEFLAEKGVEFEDIDVSSNKEARDYMVEKSKQMSVPVIEIMEERNEPQYVIGFDKDKLSQALGL